MKRSALLQERIVAFYPSLAKLVGINAAIVIQQIHFSLSEPKSGKEFNGERWVYNTYEEWQREFFPFWSVNTIQRIFATLEELGYLISCQPEGRKSRIKYYRLNRGYVEKLTIEIAETVSPEDTNLGSSDHTKLGCSEDTNLGSSLKTDKIQIKADIGSSSFDSPSPLKKKPKDIFQDLPDSINTNEFRSAWNEYLLYRTEKKLRPLLPRSVAKTWAELAEAGECNAIAAINKTIAKGWTGIFPQMPTYCV